MPKNPNNLQFSFSSEYIQKLKVLAYDQESLSLCAKRLLTEALDGIEGAITPNYSNQLSELEKRLTAIERINAIGMGYEDISDLDERLNNLESLLKSLERQLNERLRLLEFKVEAFEADSQVGEIFKQAMTQLNKKLEAEKSNQLQSNSKPKKPKGFG